MSDEGQQQKTQCHSKNVLVWLSEKRTKPRVQSWRQSIAGVGAVKTAGAKDFDQSESKFEKAIRKN
jgi:predicted SprT family Zn-dependent metalloprotease